MRKRLVAAGLVFLVLNAVGVCGYWYLADGQSTFVDALYMTITTLAGVGFGEITHNAPSPAGRAFTIALIYANLVTLTFVTTTLTAVFVEGGLAALLEKRRMDKRIDGFNEHIIVCGAGSTGIHVVRELYVTHRQVVLIELDEERIRHMMVDLDQGSSRKRDNMAYIVGDASDDQVLEQAGISRAKGLVAALPNDKDNLYITISARQHNPSLRIIARASDVSAIDKLKRSGADSVVSPNMIGGLRMVSELVRPHVVSFLDVMLRNKDAAIRVEEVIVQAGGGLAGKPLAKVAPLESFSCQVLAIRSASDAFTYNPPASTELAPGMVLIVLGEADRVADMRRAATLT